MADTAVPKRRRSITNENPLKYAFDSGLFPNESTPNDTPETVEFEDGSDDESDQSSESEAESADLVESLRVLSESMLRRELEELEMIKEREKLRLEAEKRRMELETQMTQMMMQTQLQIASFVCRKSSNRKRKRSDDNVNLGAPERDGATLMSLVQCNLISTLDQLR